MPFLKDIPSREKPLRLYLQFVCIAIIKLQFEVYRVICIMVSLDIHIIDNNTITQLLITNVISVNYVRSYSKYANQMVKQRVDTRNEIKALGIKVF